MKLNKFLKDKRESLIHLLGKSLKLYHNGHVTIAFVKTSHNRGKIAWSIHSDTDGKFHRKYGEWVALDKLYGGVGLPVEFWHDEDINKMLYEIAQYVGCME